MASSGGPSCWRPAATVSAVASAARAVSFAVLLLLLRGLHRDVLPDSKRATIWLFPWVASTMFWWQMAAGFADLTAFADDCFHRGMAAFRRDHPAAIVPHAGDVVDRLHAAGIEIVVVSNSPAEKIAAWFAAVGVDAGPDPGHDLRVIGIGVPPISCISGNPHRIFIGKRLKTSPP